MKTLSQHAQLIQDIRQLIAAGATPDTMPPELITLYFVLKKDEVGRLPPAPPAAARSS